MIDPTMNESIGRVPDDAPADRSRKILAAIGAVALAISGALFAAGCNTTAGVGEDIEAGGDALEEAAEDAN